MEIGNHIPLKPLRKKTSNILRGDEEKIEARFVKDKHQSHQRRQKSFIATSSSLNINFLEDIQKFRTNTHCRFNLNELTLTQ